MDAEESPQPIQSHATFASQGLPYRPIIGSADQVRGKCKQSPRFRIGAALYGIWVADIKRYFSPVFAILAHFRRSYKRD